jgi:hypothetical protein
MPSSFYAVARGRCPGIYETWPEAHAQTSGHKGALFKKFQTKEEAEAFIQHGGRVEQKVYVVAVGRRPGIYDDWASASQQVTGFRNAVYQKMSRAEADDFLQKYHANRTTSADLNASASRIIAESTVSAHEHASSVDALDTAHAVDAHDAGVSLREESISGEIARRDERSRSRESRISLASCGTSFISSVGAARQCFTADTELQINPTTKKRVDDLELNDMVLDKDGNMVEIVRTCIHKGYNLLVELRTQKMHHVVTASHRVVVQVDDTTQEDREAHLLKEGDSVIEEGTPEVLTQVAQYAQDTPVVDLQFRDDAAVKAYMPTAGLVTRGRATHDFRPRRDQAHSASPRAQPRSAPDFFTDWSEGSINHDDSNPGACKICWPYHRHHHCPSGSTCTKCHHEHPECPRRLRNNRGSGSHVFEQEATGE